jgi:hypothetical protein
MQGKIPGEYKLELVQFRHSKHKDFIIELADFIEKNAQQFKER